MKPSAIVVVYIIFGVYHVPNAWGIMNIGRNPPVSEDRADLNYHPHVLENSYPKTNFALSQKPVQFSANHGHLVQPGDRSGDAHGELSNIQIEMSSTTNLTESGGQLVYFIVKNLGPEDEYVRVNVTDKHGYAQEMQPTEFYLPNGATREVSVLMNHPPNAHHDSPDIITVNASGKRSTVKRSAYYSPWNDILTVKLPELFQQYDYSHQQPFCYDRYVTGNCRYRTAPYDCENYKWTAYATIKNPRGIQQLRSIPEGLYVPEFTPGTTDGLRIYLTVTCCVPIVQFLSVNPYYPNVGNACIVDVRELQGLNAAEIAGIVVGVLILIIIIIVIIALLIRKKRQRTILVGHSTTTREHVVRE
ncbi:unnamed protein product [Allacma fusca]|uniref:Uncharacterized protein n=1 Tax=Allacma fusca TaxID=39272 RepID=A0A8J2PXB2_9HEXA|nr:unnamed protein product [Allacma fusca]